ncbi:ybcA domain protein [Escherichia coli 6-175-07_S3_C2]|nr:ybcA domain protein [Escherichia coli 6-175-07_S3_C2]
MPLTPDHVTHYNALQVKFAEQYVFCGEKDFSLVERMLADSGRYRTGPRFTF